ncbi:MAG TPA: serine hydrolase [Cytophagaceae bacterium]
MKKFLVIFCASVALCYCIIIALDKKFVFTVFRYNLPDLDDYRIFANRKVPHSRNPQPWPKKFLYNQLSLPDSTQIEMEKLNTTACIIIHKDSLLFEKYWDNKSLGSYSNSFSMAKSYVSALIGVALKEGKIKSLEEPVAIYLDEFKEGKKGAITLRHLLCMSSGLDWEEAYFNPFSTVSEAYYGNNLKKIIYKLKPIEKPGQRFQYKGGDTQILALVLEKVYGHSLSKILYDKIWGPLGAEQPALWSLDRKKGTEKASCCLNSNAKDFARLASLYLHKGNWRGAQLIDSSFIENSTQPIDLADGSNQLVDFYGYQWWLIPSYNKGAIFYARGILGQYIIVDPTFNLVIVRLGNKRGEKIGSHQKEVYSLIEAARGMTMDL